MSLGAAVVTHRGASEQLPGRGHEARASGPGWVAMVRGGVGDRGVRRSCIVVGRFGQGAMNDQRVLTTRIRRPRPTSPSCGRRHRDDRRRSIQSGDTVWRTTGTNAGSCCPCSARADLSARSVRGMDEIFGRRPRPRQAENRQHYLLDGRPHDPDGLPHGFRTAVTFVGAGGYGPESASSASRVENHHVLEEC